MNDRANDPRHTKVFKMIDTQWPVFEVFHQQARGEAHVHVGAIHAPDAEMALLLAKIGRAHV